MRHYSRNKKQRCETTVQSQTQTIKSEPAQGGSASGVIPPPLVSPPAIPGLSHHSVANKYLETLSTWIIDNELGDDMMAEQLWDEMLGMCAFAKVGLMELHKDEKRNGYNH